ncbi:MAG: hypothetical protein EA402_07240 [Planctomycetota bacterium]|nr:MAG: hypothetical protein EA402_07240 [Planctomycetota bacterium]
MRSLASLLLVLLCVLPLPAAVVNIVVPLPALVLPAELTLGESCATSTWDQLLGWSCWQQVPSPAQIAGALHHHAQAPYTYDAQGAEQLLLLVQGLDRAGPVYRRHLQVLLMQLDRHVQAGLLSEVRDRLRWGLEMDQRFDQHSRSW